MKRMHRFLVPTDFSEASRNAAEYAASMALVSGAGLVLIHAVHIPVAASDLPEPDIRDEMIMQENEVKLNLEAKHIGTLANVPVECLTKFGSAKDVIRDEDQSADITVIGMKTNSAKAGPLQKSVIPGILRHVNQTILLVPGESKFEIPACIVFACDYSEGTLAAVRALKFYVENFESTILMLNINPQMDEILHRRILKRKIEDILGKDHVKYFFEEEYDMIDKIRLFAKDHMANIIAVMPHHKHILQRLFHRSVTLDLAGHTRLPILVLPTKI